MTKLYDEMDYLPGPIIYKPIPQAPDAGVVAELVEAAEHVLRDIDDLVASSEGVAGLHMNGDVADWQSLLDGGSFGSWLSSPERLRAALALIAHNTTEG